MFSISFSFFVAKETTDDQTNTVSEYASIAKLQEHWTLFNLSLTLMSIIECDDYQMAMQTVRVYYYFSFNSVWLEILHSA